ncbi:protein of unknown function DUF323 [Rhodopirellula islandica]|uniref:Calcineurin-like phosphoesterase domain-containing protein n=1 Tax=Rhodopirellula islandica TaxID=595434 RepID=A0A0J1BDJ0_RHOIS|nr:metallophosphoesterase [Rhodopirellula islandica]KLU04615.1 protein of unknown function DUF323 [Rhodopirellula islandica]
MFRILHISDLHASESDKWKTDSVLREARKKLVEQCSENPVDVVAFTGDIANRGSRKEYDIAEQWIERTCLNKDGLNLEADRLLFVPGNHDVDRAKRSVVAKALEATLCEVKNQDDVATVFNDKASRDALFDRHWQYKKFIKKVTGKSLSTEGAWTRCFSFESSSIAFHGLNSSWLCRDDSDQRRLLVGDAQLSCLGEDIDKGDVSIALAHHPHPDLMEFDEDTFENFLRNHADMFLRGHLHKPDVVNKETSSGGYLEIAAGSLYHGAKAPNRFNIIDISRSLTEVTISTFVWQNDRWILDRNAFADSNDGLGRYTLPDRKSAGASKENQREELTAGIIRTDPFLNAEIGDGEDAKAATDSPRTNLLNRFPRFSVKATKQHAAIRHDAMSRSEWAIENERVLRLFADWGSDPDAFLASLTQRLKNDGFTTFLHARCGNVVSGKDLQTRLSKYAGTSAVELGAALRSEDKTILILDELSFDEEFNNENSSLFATIRAFLDYCSNLSVICVAHGRVPRNHLPSGVVPLTVLDDADTREYLENHETRPVRLDDVFDYSRIRRATGGVIRRIDDFVDAIRYTDFDGAIASIAEHTNSADHDLPTEVIDAIAMMASSEEDDHKRAYSLLSVLCILDHGETLKTIKRIRQQSPLWARHATTLEDAGILDVSPSVASNIEEDSLARSAGGEKILHVPRLIRDHVLSIMPRDYRIELLKKTCSVFFGSDWRVGGIRPKPRSSEAGMTSYIATSNELCVIRSVLLEAASGEELVPCTGEEAARLALRFTSYLNSKGLYGEAYESAKEALSIIGDSHAYDSMANVRDELKLLAAKCARMVGEHTASIRLLKETLEVSKNAGLKQRTKAILIAMALAYESLGMEHEAEETAEEVVRMSGNNTADYLQAKAIIAKYNCNSEGEAIKALKRLMQRARGHGHHTVGDNIAIEIASRSSAVNEILKQLASVRTRHDREYNFVRATIRRIETLLNSNRLSDISTLDREDLKVCYSLTFSQRMRGMFNWCNRVIWELANQSDDEDLFFRLYWHSSFFWRLHQDVASEEKFSRKLVERFPLPISGPTLSPAQLTILRYCSARLKTLSFGPTLVPLN